MNCSNFNQIYILQASIQGNYISRPKLKNKKIIALLLTRFATKNDVKRVNCIFFFNVFVRRENSLWQSSISYTRGVELAAPRTRG